MADPGVMAARPTASAGDFCAAFPGRAERLLAALDLSRPGLEVVARGAARGDRPEAPGSPNR